MQLQISSRCFGKAIGDSVNMDCNALPTLAVIVPVLNDAHALERNLQSWTSRRGNKIKLISVDGGSADHSYQVGSALSDICCQAPSGRAGQMNTGAALANARYYLFLHADTHISDEAFNALIHLLDSEKKCWGFYPVRLNNPKFMFRIIERMMNARSRLTKVATGDQCLFVAQDLFKAVQGFEDIPLMEDVAISKQLRRISKPSMLDVPVVTSARRWETHGIFKTIFLMWGLRLAYFLGVPAKHLHQLYYLRQASD